MRRAPSSPLVLASSSSAPCASLTYTFKSPGSIVLHRGHRQSRQGAHVLIARCRQCNNDCCVCQQAKVQANVGNMPRLQTEPTNAPRTYWKDLKALLSWNSPESGHRWPLFKSILVRSVRIKLTKDEATVLPLRVRPAFIVLNFLDLTVLAFLGFHPRGQDWVKLNDKILHFLCFFIVSVNNCWRASH